MCFAKFVKTDIDFTKDVEDTIIQRDTHMLKVYGKTKDTKKYFECGDGAAKNLLPYPL